MDSEEEYVSGMSTDGEGMQEYSGDEMSAADGAFVIRLLCRLTASACTPHHFFFFFFFPFS